MLQPCKNSHSISSDSSTAMAKAILKHQQYLEFIQAMQAQQEVTFHMCPWLLTCVVSSQLCAAAPASACCCSLCLQKTMLPPWSTIKRRVSLHAIR